jgi:hypothetical protein
LLLELVALGGTGGHVEVAEALEGENGKCFVPGLYFVQRLTSSKRASLRDSIDALLQPGVDVVELTQQRFERLGEIGSAGFGSLIVEVSGGVFELDRFEVQWVRDFRNSALDHANLTGLGPKHVTQDVTVFGGRGCVALEPSFGAEQFGGSAPAAVTGSDPVLLERMFDFDDAVDGVGGERNSA